MKIIISFSLSLSCSFCFARESSLKVSRALREKLEGTLRNKMDAVSACAFHTARPNSAVAVAAAAGCRRGIARVIRAPLLYYICAPILVQEEPPSAFPFYA